MYFLTDFHFFNQNKNLQKVFNRPYYVLRKQYEMVNVFDKSDDSENL